MPAVPLEGGSDAVDGLREAVRLSPENVPLRQTLADTLLALRRPAEAEREYREALHLAPERLPLKFGLARAFFAQAKHSHALALIETVTQSAGAPARAFVLHARLLAGAGEVEQAVIQYRRAVDLDPAAADPEFAARLGLEARPDTAEVVDGRVRLGSAALEAAGDADFLDGGEGEEEREGIGDENENENENENEDEDDDEEQESVGAAGPRRGRPAGTDIERPRIGFRDVGGMESLKDEIRLKIIHPLTHADLYRAYGKSVGGGILLYGPPGCGKTHLARATAGEIRAGFVSVGINEVLDMWVGSSERNLHELFETARRHRPCVLFFDEVDALGASRSDLRHHAGRQLVNQFLAEFDGVRASNEGVLILAATNAPWHLDPAFRRPGRFDRILFVPPPDPPARAEILRIQLAGKPAVGLDLEALARKTDGFSGADLKAVVDVAVEAKLREALAAGVPKPIAQKDLLAAAAALRPTTREWFASARNYALYANQGGLYDDILTFLKLK